MTYSEVGLPEVISRRIPARTHYRESDRKARRACLPACLSGAVNGNDIHPVTQAKHWGVSHDPLPIATPPHPAGQQASLSFFNTSQPFLPTSVSTATP